MSVSITIQNAHRNGNRIDGDIVLDVDVLGAKFQKSQPFSTDGNSSYSFNAAGCTVTLNVVLKLPNQVCVSGDIKPPFGSFAINEQCLVVP